MAIKTFTTGEVLTAADTNTYLANSGWVNVAAATHSGAATLNFNNVFTSTYANYKIVCSWDAASSGSNYVTMRMRASGTDTSTSIYTSYASWTSTAATGVDRYTSSDSWRVMFYSTAGRAQLEMLITAPQLAKNTTFFATSLDVRTTDFVGQTGAGVIRDTVQYDGFTFIAPGNVNGITTIYGLRAG